MFRLILEASLLVDKQFMADAKVRHWQQKKNALEKDGRRTPI